MKMHQLNKTIINISKAQVLIGLATLFFGFVVYIIRSPGYVYFVPKSLSCLQFSDHIQNVVRLIGGNLPDFIHPFAFILITSGLLSLNSKISQFFVCMGWFIIESFFELGQYFKESYLRIIPSWFSDIPVLENTKNYFLIGTFDIMDMFSIFAGTVAAFCLLLITSKRRNKE